MEPVYIASVHEAGHAVVAEVLGRRVLKVTVEQNGDGLCLLEPSPTSPPSSPTTGAESPLSKEEIAALERLATQVDPDLALAQIAHRLQGIVPDEQLGADLIRSMAGRIAQMRVTSEEAALQGAQGDMVTERMLAHMLSDHVGNIALFLANARSLAQHYVDRHWPAILHVATALAVRREMSGDEVRAILKQHATLKGERSVDCHA